MKKWNACKKLIQQDVCDQQSDLNTYTFEVAWHVSGPFFSQEDFFYMPSPSILFISIFPDFIFHADSIILNSDWLIFKLPCRMIFHMSHQRLMKQHSYRENFLKELQVLLYFFMCLWVSEFCTVLTEKHFNFALKMAVFWVVVLCSLVEVY
jgi:hypothetical protein